MSEEKKLVLAIVSIIAAFVCAPAAITVWFFSGLPQPYPTVCHNKVEYFLDDGVPSYPVIDPDTMKPQRCERLPLEAP